MDKVTKVQFKYDFDEQYDPEYINGVIGGQTPQGELVMNFFMERMPIPYEQTDVINGDGTFEAPLDLSNILSIRRRIKNGVIMSQGTALSVYNWLKNNLRSMGVDENDL